MKQKILNLFFLISISIGSITLSSCTQAEANPSSQQSLIHVSNAITSNEAAKVYICTGPNSKRYHKHSCCKGLNKCSGQIKEVTVEKAQSLGRTPCGICYK